MPKSQPPSATVRLADNVRAEMARQRLTQFDLARALNLSQAAVSRRLSGLTPFDVNEVQAVGDLLGLPATVLLGEEVA